MLAAQQAFFVELRKQVKRHFRKKPDEMKAQVEKIRSALLAQGDMSRYVGDFLPAQVQKVCIEFGGKPFLVKEAALEEHQHHARAHGKDLSRQ